jgi:hypothetical protein
MRTILERGAGGDVDDSVVGHDSDVRQIGVGEGQKLHEMSLRVGGSASRCGSHHTVDQKNRIVK